MNTCTTTTPTAPEETEQAHAATVEQLIRQAQPVDAPAPDQAGTRKVRGGSSWRRKITTAVLVILAGVTLTTTLSATSASAINPPQTTSVGSARTLYPDINAFWTTSMRNWGWSAYYHRPVVHFYNQATVQCGGVRLAAANSYACGGRYLGNIWFGTGFTQGLHNRFGDYGSGVVLAHEWGHEIMYGIKWASRARTTVQKSIGEELFADCLAGMYTHYGLLVSRKLNSSDYWEGYRALASMGHTGGDHGTARQRADWYQYGYTNYNIYSCARVLG